MNLDKILHDKKFVELNKSHCREILEYLIHKKINFSIVCNVSCVKFEPELPSEIKAAFSELTVFILAGYTFESLELDENNLYFEAGFGEENLGSFVTTPLESIVQILLPNETDIRADFCVFINLLATYATPKSKDNFSDEGVNSSMKALLSNPKNHKFKR
ncbi:hypothetical protein [Helicobacter canadensis]|uniref:Uncharacterized protein n=1 Tax=Helicobacter canadensis MIT 98-5491 TaxID=537970 RepID=C5ZXV0_9HELI|nr:hypothetical protein [Helicobacter canadensis]EES89968.1 conserved hypothetical protein [Helicobacter canadensis MIT 98-5491]EFR49115.1 hypothetical protein HCMG_01288 [Helicobacter canadensis MIT 98-5491]STP02533.1 Uncharacterised protein [Helicobacter canadensis]